MFYTSEERTKEIKKEVQSLRAAASNICRIKKVVSAFDGKIYNCKFDNAIETLSNDSVRIYSHINSYGYFILDFYDKDTNKTINLIYTKKATKDTETDYFTSNKRIKAEHFINVLNDKYAELLKRATDIERSSENITTTLQQLESLKKSMNVIIAGLPTEITSIYNLKHIY